MKSLSARERRRLAVFRNHRRGWWSAWIFIALLWLSLPAEFIANDRPLVVRYRGELFIPVFFDYPETAFAGGEFETTADYRDPFVRQLIQADGWMLWPPIRYSFPTVK